MKPSGKIVLVVLFAAQSFLAAAQTNTAAAPADYSTFSKLIADRNIFDPNRVPNVPWHKLPPRPPVVYTPPPPQPASFSLVGVIGYGEGKLAGTYAFFDGTSQQYRKTVQLNGGIASFKVADITADSVTLTTGTNSRTILKLGEQLHDDGSGHWLTANGNDVRYNTGGNGRFGNRNGFGNGNGNGGRRQRNNNFGGNNGNFNNNNGNFNRVRNNYNSGAAGSNFDNSQAQDQNMDAQNDNNAPDNNAPDNNAPDNTAAPDDNAPPDNNFVMPPPDFNAPPDQGQQNN